MKQWLNLFIQENNVIHFLCSGDGGLFGVLFFFPLFLFLCFFETQSNVALAGLGLAHSWHWPQIFCSSPKHFDHRCLETMQALKTSFLVFYQGIFYVIEPFLIMLFWFLFLNTSFVFLSVAATLTILLQAQVLFKVLLWNLFLLFCFLFCCCSYHFSQWIYIYNLFWIYIYNLFYNPSSDKNWSLFPEESMLQSSSWEFPTFSSTLLPHN